MYALLLQLHWLLLMWSSGSLYTHLHSALVFLESQGFLVLDVFPSFFLFVTKSIFILFILHFVRLWPKVFMCYYIHLSTLEWNLFWRPFTFFSTCGLTKFLKIFRLEKCFTQKEFWNWISFLNLETWSYQFFIVNSFKMLTNYKIFSNWLIVCERFSNPNTSIDHFGD